MEELIDRLRELNEPVPVPLELPDADVLVEVQEQILIHLPYELKEFLLSVSDVVYGHLEPVTVCDPQSHTYLPEIAAQAWDAGMPRWLVPLCADGPQVYAVDPDGRVLLWEEGSEEAGGELGEWDSVWHWVHEVWLEGNL